MPMVDLGNHGKAQPHGWVILDGTIPPISVKSFPSTYPHTAGSHLRDLMRFTTRHNMNGFGCGSKPMELFWGRCTTSF